MDQPMPDAGPTNWSRGSRPRIRGAGTNGVTREEIQEVSQQTAICCGVPAAIDAFRNAGEAFKEFESQRRSPQWRT